MYLFLWPSRLMLIIYVWKSKVKYLVRQWGKKNHKKFKITLSFLNNLLHFYKQLKMAFFKTKWVSEASCYAMQRLKYRGRFGFKHPWEERTNCGGSWHKHADPRTKPDPDPIPLRQPQRRGATCFGCSGSVRGSAAAPLAAFQKKGTEKKALLLLLLLSKEAHSVHVPHMKSRRYRHCKHPSCVTTKSLPFCLKSAHYRLKPFLEGRVSKIQVHTLR